MTLLELIEQLELIKSDHPETGEFEVRANELAIFAVNRNDDGDGPYIEIELFRPWALS